MALLLAPPREVRGDERDALGAADRKGRGWCHQLDEVVGQVSRGGAGEDSVEPDEAGKILGDDAYGGELNGVR